MNKGLKLEKYNVIHFRITVEMIDLINKGLRHYVSVFVKVPSKLERMT